MTPLCRETPAHRGTFHMQGLSLPRLGAAFHQLRELSIPCCSHPGFPRTGRELRQLPEPLERHKVMPAVQHGAVQGSVGQRWRVSSPWGGALLFISKLPASCQGVWNWLGAPGGCQAQCPGPGQQGGRWLGSWGPGSRGGAGTPFSPDNCSILV